MARKAKIKRPTRKAAPKARVGTKRNPRGILPFWHFIDHDPIIDLLDTAIADSGYDFKGVSLRCRTSVSTLLKYKRKEVKQPRFSTVMNIIMGLGALDKLYYFLKEEGKVIHLANHRAARRA